MANEKVNYLKKVFYSFSPAGEKLTDTDLEKLVEARSQEISEELDNADEQVEEQVEEKYAFLPEDFKYHEKHGGLMVLKRKNGKPVIDEDTEEPIYMFVCKHVEPLGRVDGSAKCGLILTWRKDNGARVRLVLPDRLLYTPGMEWAQMLAENGLRVNPGQEVNFKRFAVGVHGLPNMTNTTRVGWFERRCYVLPSESFGRDARGLEVFLQTSGRMAVGISEQTSNGEERGISDLYTVGGSLEAWQNMARLCAGNTRFEFALACSFGAALLAFAGAMDGSIFNLYGESSSGKTTALEVGSSVWGNPLTHKKTWRLTDNGLEGIAPLFNDGLLCLDELGQVGGKALSEVSYMFAGGTGKQRASRSGGARAVASWNGLILSSGELAMATKLAEAGLQPRAGQMVRFMDIPAEREHLASLHGQTAAELINALKNLSLANYGHAGREFLRRLLPRLNDLAALGNTLDAIESRLCPAKADAQVMRVGRRFALVCAGGEWAQMLGVLPTELKIFDAVKACFDSWLEKRAAGLGKAETAEILAQVRKFIEQHGASRFQHVDAVAEAIRDRLGFWKDENGVRVYLVLPEMFRSELCKGYDYIQVAKVLHNAGLLEKQGNRYSVVVRIAGFGTRRVYAIRLPDEEF